VGTLCSVYHRHSQLDEQCVPANGCSKSREREREISHDLAIDMVNFFIRVSGCQIAYGRHQSEASNRPSWTGMHDDIMFVYIVCYLCASVNADGNREHQGMLL